MQYAELRATLSAASVHQTASRHIAGRLLRNVRAYRCEIEFVIANLEVGDDRDLEEGNFHEIFGKGHDCL